MAQDRSQTESAIDTIAAAATPPGVGALGLVRLSGPRAYPIALSFLRVGSGSLQPRRATNARAEASGSAIDLVLATYFPGPRSATGEDLVEISAHGSPYILRKLLEEALRAGARLAEPGEFTQRAFLNGRMDLAQAEAVCELIRARTETAHRAALAQLDGGLSQAVAAVRAPILDLLVRIEACLDHPEEDLPALSLSETRERLEASRAELDTLARTYQRGRLVSEGAKVCIVGRPNAGKSSLLNALLGRDRAIVCATPGTTRDTIEEPAELLGLPAVLIDTAGLREDAADAAEEAGIERTRRALSHCDLALLVVDGSQPYGDEDRRLLERAAALGRPVLTVLSKCDLPSRPSTLAADVSVSALSGAGLEDLRARIADSLSAEAPPEVMVLSIRHHQALTRAAADLAEAAAALGRYPAAWEDRVASHLRGALASLGEITGDGVHDEVLRAIFSKFCIGK